MILAASLCVLIAVAGMAAVLAGTVAVRRFAALPSPMPHARPPLTILRPLCGAEPGLDEALDSLAAQAYPTFQIVLGVHDTADPAHDAARRFAARHAALDIAIVANPAVHGSNRKISSLMNMLPAARHDTLVFSDSDVHVAPDYLDQIVAALDLPRTGLVTTLSVGRLVRPTLVSRLAASHMRHCFLPGVLLARWGGRQDCLGTTMALRRDTLGRVGGLSVLADHVADDNVLGQLVAALGLRVTLARTITAATVAESTFTELWHHELRWARTIGALFPLTFASSAVQFPLFWAALACLVAPGRPEFLTVLAAALILRAWAARSIDGLLAARFAVPSQRGLLALLAVRDVLSVLIVAASFLGRSVVWRGRVLRASGFRAPAPAPFCRQACHTSEPQFRLRDNSRAPETHGL
jgi:ceramide glucosyltransferase